MSAIRVAVAVIWVIFWVGWLVAASTAKETVSRGNGWRGRTLLVVLVVVFLRLLRPRGLEIQSVAVAAIGLVVVLAGLGLAVWARVYLGRNWGMPTSVRAEPELVTTGPYCWVRHPIYTGLIVAVLGSSLVFNLLGLVVVVGATALFYYSARIEEQNMTEAFPLQYSEYMEHTKMLIPFVL